MAKKKLSTSQRKRRYFLYSWTTFICEFVAFAAPFVTIGIVNYDKYFVEYSGTKMSIAFFVAMGVMGVGIWGISKKKLENTYVALIIKWIIWAFIFTMLGEIIRDVASIMWFGLIGLMGAFGLDEVSKHYEKKYKNIIKGKEKADEEDLVEEIKEEKAQKELQKQEKKIKVRIKK